MKNANGWSQLQVRHLAALKAVADKRSFGGAAAKLGYSQSAISHQIGALERIVGATLVERPGGRKPVSLTQAGRLLLGHADAIVARAQTARAELAAVSSGADASLRVGSYQSLAVRVLPDLLAELAETWPNVTVELHEAYSHREPYELLAASDLDLSFGELPVPDGPFEFVPMARDPYVLVVPAGSELATTEGRVPLDRLQGLPVVGFRSEPRALLHLRTLGIDTETVLSADDNRTIQGLVAARELAAIMPRLTVSADDPQTTVLDLGPELPPRVLGVAWRRGRPVSPAAEEFVRIAARLCAPMRQRSAAG